MFCIWSLCRYAFNRLTEAFDTIKHILIKFTRFSQEKTEWFKFYQSNRKFKVHVKNTFFEPWIFLHRVLEGIILGLLLFLFRSSHWKCSVKKVFLEILQNSQENICGRVSFLIKLQAYFYTPWKRQKTKCFLTFSGCIEISLQIY